LRSANRHYRTKPGGRKAAAALSEIARHWLIARDSALRGNHAVRKATLARMRCRFGREIYSESVEQTRPARRGQQQRAAVTLALEPAELETAAPDFRADKAGEVRPALTPVEAGPAEHALALRIQVGPEFGQESCAGRRQLAAILGQ